MDTIKVLDALLTAFMPFLNQAIPKYIKDAGLDPWKAGFSGSKTLGKIDLGICKASVKASYSFKDIKGLSSLVITEMKYVERNTSQEPTITGAIELKAVLNSDISAKVSGKITAGCGGINESVGISGKAKAEGVTGIGVMVYTAELAAPQSCYTKMEIKNLNLMYSDIDVDIDGLGMFNKFMNPLVDTVNGAFGDLIKGAISDVLETELNKLIKGIMPFCITVSE